MTPEPLKSGGLSVFCLAQKPQNPTRQGWKDGQDWWQSLEPSLQRAVAWERALPDLRYLLLCPVSAFSQAEA